MENSGAPSKAKKTTGLKQPTRVSRFVHNFRDHKALHEILEHNTRPASASSKSSSPTTSPKRPVAVHPGRLRRRSKSVTDMRPLGAAKKMMPPPLVSRGVKRPAAKTAEDVVKPKVAKKPKIPDWDYKARFNELQGRFQAMEASVKKANSDLDKCNKENYELKNQSDSSVVELIKLRETHKKLQLNHDQLQERYNFSERTIQLLRNENAELQEGLSKLKRNHERLEEKHQKIEVKLWATEQENDTLKADETQLKSDLADCRTQIADYEALTERMQREADNYEIQRRKLHNTIQDLKGNIRVFARIRGPVGDEDRQRPRCTFSLTDENTLEIKSARDGTVKGNGPLRQEFNFDRVFPEESTQAEVFEELSQLVLSALDGYNVCVFAYGQTGSGKTYTMQGMPEQLGMIPRTVDLIFEWMAKFEKSNWSYNIKASFLEIYNESIRDLLQLNQKNQYTINYNEGRGVTVTNLKIVDIKSADHLLKLIEEAHRNRAVAATDFNEHSSRSHAVTKIYIEGHNDASNVHCLSSINLVDLAGSESAKTSSSERLTETKNINKSLSNLETVMIKLSNKENHIPYRNSKLTFLLQSSLGGNSKTLMFVNVAPFDECYGESIRALRFASTVKKVKMTLKKNNKALTRSNSNLSIPSTSPPGSGKSSQSRNGNI